MPITAILFGGRRASVVPLVHEARDWESRRLPRLDDVVGDDGRRQRRGGQVALRSDGDAAVLRLPLADYWGHWLKTGDEADAGQAAEDLLRQLVPQGGADGKFLWPGYGENSRVLAWVFGRCDGTAAAVDTEIGLVPPVGEGGIDTSGLDVTDDAMTELLGGRRRRLAEQLPQIREHYARFGDRLPAQLRGQLRLRSRPSGALAGYRPPAADSFNAFVPSDAGLLVLQAGVVAAPRAIDPVWAARLRRFRGRGWALVPIGSIVGVIFLIRYTPIAPAG